LVF
jgi:hypothetical protein